MVLVLVEWPVLLRCGNTKFLIQGSLRYVLRKRWVAESDAACLVDGLLAFTEFGPYSSWLGAFYCP